jgi:hypothetical protein
MSNNAIRTMHCKYRPGESIVLYPNGDVRLVMGANRTETWNVLGGCEVVYRAPGPGLYCRRTTTEVYDRDDGLVCRKAVLIRSDPEWDRDAVELSSKEERFDSEGRIVEIVEIDENKNMKVSTFTYGVTAGQENK